MIILYRIYSERLTDIMNKTNFIVCAGHCSSMPGAKNEKYGLVEYEETLKVVEALKDISYRNKIIPIRFIMNQCITKKVEMINEIADVHSVCIDVHFNAFKIGEADGLEVYHYPNSVNGNKLAVDLYMELASRLPFKMRGVKTNSNLYFLKCTRIPAVIVELLFIDNEGDISYMLHPRAHEIIATALYYGLLNSIGERM